MKKILLVIIPFLIFINVNALDLNSKYVYVYNDTLDKTMYELNSNEEIKVASMTKIMTAILVIEHNQDLDKIITIKDEDLRDMYEYTTTGFQAGYEVTIRELLYGILLRSGADAVNAAVRVTTDTEEEFISLMNQKVKELNLKNTYFSNAVGKDKDNYSSVHDIAKIMEYCLKNKTFKEIISTPMHYIERLDLQINGPLYKNDKKYNLDLSLISGGKSGYTSLAKHSLVSFGEKDGITYIVVTDYANSYKNILIDTVKIYEHFFNNYGYKNYRTSFEIDIINGEEEKYNVDINTNVYLENNYNENLLTSKYEGVDKITYLNKKSSKLGKLFIYYDDELVDSMDIKLNKEIKYKTKAYTTPFIIITIVILLMLILFFLVIKKKIKRKKKNVKSKVKCVKVKTINRKVKQEKTEDIKEFIKKESCYEKKMETLNNSIDVNLFFETLKNINTGDKEKLEKNFIDRCFQNIDFENIDQLKDLYTKLKLYKKEMSYKTIQYYNRLFKYCIEEYIDKK